MKVIVIGATETIGEICDQPVNAHCKGGVSFEEVSQLI